MLHRPIPPIKEFVMKAIEAGFRDVGSVGGFLGLDELTVKATIEELEKDRYSTELDEESGSVLTERGRSVLRAARESSPQNETLVFLYDRLLLKPVRLSPDQWVAPQSVNPQQMIEIRPYPAEGPTLSDLQLPDVAHVLQQEAGGRTAFGRDILRLNRIGRRVRLYRPAVGLVYKKNRSSDIQISFVVDEVPNTALEHAFAGRGGPKRMGFIKAISESATMSELRKYIGSPVQGVKLDAEEIDRRQIAVSLARFKHQTALARAERNTSEALQDLEGAAASAVRAAEEALRAVPTRPIAPYESVEFLDTALETCRSVLIVSSRTLDRTIVDGRFMKRLTDVLKRGARVVISLTEPIGTQAPALDLERLRRRYPRLDLLIGRRRQFHHLICDDRFALVCNRPFLSNLGKVRSFHHCIGFILQEPRLVQAFTERIDPVRGNAEENLAEPKQSGSRKKRDTLKLSK
jgi:hypothetical protein